MSAQQDQRLPVRLFNGAARAVQAFTGAPTALADSEDELRAAAVKGAGGLTDFGAGDDRAGLQALLASYDRESHLNPFGRWMVRQQLIGILRGRLLAEEAWKRNPAILATPLERPIFILGLPRTGTTALHSLLARDDSNQVLEYWLAAAPRPRPPRDQWDKDPRFKEAAQGLALSYWLDPSLKAIHLLTADGAEECRHLLGQCFTDDTFECNSTLPGYSQWYAGCDMVPTYRRHRKLLQLVGSGVGGGKRWALKYPAHLRHLRALLEVYPDACIVQTHRDPARVLPSLCSLVAGWRGIYEDSPDRRAIAAWMVDLWARTMEDAMEVRRQVGEANFYDLQFRDTVSDPATAVARMYAHFGLQFSAEAEAGLRAWHSANPQHKHGEHRYSAADFGLTDAGMRERFAAYIERFDIQPEGRA